MRWNEIVTESTGVDGVLDHLKQEIERGGLAVSENSTDYIADYFRDHPEELAGFKAAVPEGEEPFRWLTKQFSVKFGIRMMDLAFDVQDRLDAAQPPAPPKPVKRTRGKRPTPAQYD
jgi:hypothetical protein